MTEDEYAAVFDLWKANYDADPEGFSYPDDGTYGQAAARYFMFLMDELNADQVK